MIRMRVIALLREYGSEKKMKIISCAHGKVNNRDIGQYNSVIDILSWG